MEIIKKNLLDRIKIGVGATLFSVKLVWMSFNYNPPKNYCDIKTSIKCGFRIIWNTFKMGMYYIITNGPAK